jgi:DNA-directed RNA polymerase subunit M/transcription elongation factor TFIIS
MKNVAKGFECSKCGHVIISNKEKLKWINNETESSNSIYIVDRSEDKYGKVSKTCPECGNKKAFQWLSIVSGEHAGINTERTIQHFKCTKCFQTWTKNT